MRDWKTEIVRVKSSITNLHDAIAKYLELTGNPSRIFIDDLETVCQLTGLFPPNITEPDLENVLSEFVVYYGFSPVPADGFFEKTPQRMP